MLNKLILILIFINGVNLLKGTDLPGLINTKVILTKDKSPYFVKSDLLVDKTGKLIIEKGVRIVLMGNFEIKIKGTLDTKGDSLNPVVFEPSEIAQFWDRVYLDGSIATLIYTILKDGIIKSQMSNLFCDNLRMELKNKDLTNVESIFYIGSGNVHISNSYFSDNGIGPGILIHYSNSIIENSQFYNCPDAIELLEVKNGIIRNNKIYNSQDDGIDLDDGDNVIISENLIVNAIDKGISIGNEGFGSSDNVIIENNIIVGCNTGISIKDSSDAKIDRNTLCNNEIGIECYRKTKDIGGASGTVINTIVIGSKQPVFVDEYSLLEINYSLNDSIALEGNNNINKNPLFRDEKNMDFRLQNSSPCIDAGDPNSRLDPDSTRADIGAFYFNQQIPEIVINEINYNSSQDFDSGDWVELYNNDIFDVDLSNWIFKGSDDIHELIIPENTFLQKGEYIIISTDTNKFKAIYPDKSIRIIVNSSFEFRNSGDNLRLSDSFNKLVDSVDYDIISPWDDNANGQGHSLELIHPDIDNSISENWGTSKTSGTPGIKNDSFRDSASATGKSSLIITKVYPNPASYYLIIETITPNDLPIYCTLTDITGKIFKPNVEIFYSTNGKKMLFIYLNEVSEGFYNLVIINNTISTHYNFIKLK